MTPRQAIKADRKDKQNIKESQDSLYLSVFHQAFNVYLRFTTDSLEYHTSEPTRENYVIDFTRLVKRNARPELVNILMQGRSSTIFWYQLKRTRIKLGKLLIEHELFPPGKYFRGETFDTYAYAADFRNNG